MTKRALSFLLRALRAVLALLTLAVSVWMAGCSNPEPTPTPTPVPTRTPTPAPTPTPTPQPIDLVVLHTNDALGHTEPCG